MGIFDKPFGGIPVIFAGDFNQLNPVKAGPLLTEALVQIALHRLGNPSNCNKNNRTQKKASDTSKFNDGHPFTVGANLLSKSKWIELTEQLRCEDVIHNNFLH